MNRRHILAPLALLLLGGCESTTPLEFRGNVAVSFATRSAAGTPLATVFRTRAMDDTLTSGTDTLVIESVEIVLREIELKRATGANCDVSTEPDDCEEIEFGPVLVDLPLDPGAQQQFAIELPADTYTEVDFKVHKVDDSDPADAAFIQAHPNFVDRSIVVRGTFNGTSFTYETDLNVEQELDLVPPLVVEDALSTNVTIRVDVTTWFRNLSGGLIDPNTANKGGNNESLVEENIKNSFKAFEDRDRDGEESDG